MGSTWGAKYSGSGEGPSEPDRSGSPLGRIDSDLRDARRAFEASPTDDTQARYRRALERAGVCVVGMFAPIGKGVPCPCLKCEEDRARVALAVCPCGETYFAEVRRCCWCGRRFDGDPPPALVLACPCGFRGAIEEPSDACPSCGAE